MRPPETPLEALDDYIVRKTENRPRLRIAWNVAFLIGVVPGSCRWFDLQHFRRANVRAADEADIGRTKKKDHLPGQRNDCAMIDRPRDDRKNLGPVLGGMAEKPELGLTINK